MKSNFSHEIRFLIKWSSIAALILGLRCKWKNSLCGFYDRTIVILGAECTIGNVRRLWSGSDRLRVALKAPKYCYRARNEGWFPYDRRRSRIADRKKVCGRLRSYGNTLLRSSAILRSWSQTIAEDRTVFYLLWSSAINCDRAIIWIPKFCDLRSKRIP